MSDAATSAAPAATPAAPSTSAPAAPVTKTASGIPTPAAKGASLSTGTPAKPTNPTLGGAANDNAESAGAQTTAEKIEAAKRKYKLKVDGEEREEELSDDEIAVRLQKAYGSEKRFQEAANLKKQLADIVKLGKENPGALLEKLYGIKPQEYAEKVLAEEYKRKLMSPEEVAAQQEKERLAALERERDEWKSKWETRQKEELVSKTQAEYEQTFIQALEHADVDRTPETLYEMARIAKLNLEQGLDLTPAQLAAEVKRSVDGAQKKLLAAVTKSLKGEKLLAYLGDDVVKEINRASVERHKAKQSFEPPKPPVQEEAPSDDAGKKRVVSSTEFRRRYLLGIEK